MRAPAPPGPVDRLEAMYDEMLPVVFGFCRARLPEHDAEDTCAEVFRAAAERLRADPELELGRGWFLTAARHRIIDRWRRQERWEQRLVLVAVDERADESVEVLRSDVHALLDRLPAAQRAVLVLHYLEGRPVKEVAAILERSPAAVESLLARGRRGVVALREGRRRSNHHGPAGEGVTP